jgi:hypothetical protein
MAKLFAGEQMKLKLAGDVAVIGHIGAENLQIIGCCLVNSDRLEKDYLDQISNL